MTPRVIYKTKKFVSITIIVFGVLLLIQGVLPEAIQKSMRDKLPSALEQKK